MVRTREEGCPEIACLESSHHSAVIETEGPDLYGSYFRRKEWLKGGRSLKTKWYQNGWTECNQECIINRVEEVLCILPALLVYFTSQ